MIEESLETVQPDIVVSVTGDTIACQPDPYSPPRGNRKTIVWALDVAASKDWRFADEGIVIKVSNDQFSGPGVIAAGSRFKLIDRNSDTGYYDYAVNLVNRASGQPLSVDPQIRNSGD